MKFKHTYSELGSEFYQNIAPTPVVKPQRLLWNEALAQQLSIPFTTADNDEEIALFFSGSSTRPDAKPIALAYSGHQFGHFNPQLGDGRAHLLGELVNDKGELQDIQLKGSGATIFSRQGDGRCALAPALREYLMSEAMFALGVPTTRCLAVVSTGETVQRDGLKPGAIVTRVANSHIRVGTFQYFSARQNINALKKLTAYCIQRHFPEIDTNQEDHILPFIRSVMDKHITLIVHWMRVGFIHGVMNTDNTSIFGETIDYGPCAMLGQYAPNTVYSSIDKNGRYAFANQANISQWNFFRFVETLIPLIDADEDTAVSIVKPIVEEYSSTFSQQYYLMMAHKIGFATSSEQSIALVDDLLSIMQANQLDYTVTFFTLTKALSLNIREKNNNGKKNSETMFTETMICELSSSLLTWYNNWLSYLNDTQENLAQSLSLMSLNNPVVIPRNHHVERLVSSAELTENMDEILQFLAVIRSPYEEISTSHYYQDLPTDGDKYFKTFCGT